MTILVAYDAKRAAEILRDWSPQDLLHELRAGRFGTELSAAEIEELECLTRAWLQRALGALPLRDALMVDSKRGGRAYHLICSTLVAESCLLPEPMGQAFAPMAGQLLTVQEVRAILETPQGGQHEQAVNSSKSPPRTSQILCLHVLLERAEAQDFALTCAPHLPITYPQPDLEQLLPPPPQMPAPAQQFVHPTGFRRTIAMLLAVLGAALLVAPLLSGHMPTQPAGIPLALLTVALLFGIRAGWAGYVGSLCIWLVANLPGFHHNRMIGLWPDVPLLIAGVVLLCIDRHVRVMWRWIRQRGRQ